MDTAGIRLTPKEIVSKLNNTSLDKMMLNVKWQLPYVIDTEEVY